MSTIKQALDAVNGSVNVEKPKAVIKENEPEEVKIVSNKKVLTEKQKEALKKGQETRLRNLELKRQALENNEPMPPAVKEYSKPDLQEPPPKATSVKSKLKKIDDLEEIIKRLDIIENKKKELIKVETPKIDEELTKPKEIPKTQDYEKVEDIKPKELPPLPVVIEQPKPEEANKFFQGRKLVKNGIVEPQFRLVKPVGKDNPFRR